MTTTPSERPPTPRWRRALPFGLALGLLGVVLARLDFAAFVAALAGVSRLGFFAVTVGFFLALLATDTLASGVLYRLTIAPIRFRDFMLLRGASYLPSLLNHHVGQASLTYFLARAYHVSVVRVAGATLVSYVTWGGCLLSLGTISLAVDGHPEWLVGFTLAGLAYLALLYAKPAALAQRQLLAALFETGVSGHLLALLARVPHLVVLFVGHWALFEVFHIHIPWSYAAVYLPILMVATTLPITPQGFGTRDAFSSVLFVQFAPGGSDAERLANIGAATVSWGIGLTLVQALLGVVLGRLALERFGDRA